MAFVRRLRDLGNGSMGMTIPKEVLVVAGIADANRGHLFIEYDPDQRAMIVDLPEPRGSAGVDVPIAESEKLGLTAGQIEKLQRAAVSIED